MFQELLVAETNMEVLLGMDFLKVHNCRLDFPRSILHLDREVLHCWDQNEDNAHFRVVSDTRTEVPPYEPVIVVGRIQRTGEITEWGLIEPCEKLTEKTDLLVGRTVVSARQDTVPVRIINCSDRPVILHPNQQLGWCDSVNWCESTDPEDGETAIFSVNQPSTPIVDDPETVPDHLQDLFQRSSKYLHDSQSEQLAHVLCQYHNIFSVTREDFGRTSLVKHGIDTGDSRPVKQPSRRLAFAKREAEKVEIEKMLKQGVIRPSSSPWASPVVMVEKKDKSMRFCIDFRRLNDLTRKDAYPLPRVDDCLESLAGAQWFSTLDLSSGYWQVELEEEAKSKTAFATRSGLYEFNVMPFGLANAPSTFERLMEMVMRSLQWEECLIYLDDIISFGTTFEQELERLTRVFDRLRHANLRLKPSKCHLFQTGVDFLGHHVSRDGIHTCEDKVEAVKSWPEPVNLKELRSFLGLCSYYRKFIKDFAKIASPLNALVKKSVTFSWTEGCQHAFDQLKQTLTSAPVLAYPEMEGQFVLDCDASKVAVGAVLSQVQDGQEKVIAYSSRTLNSHEKNYCVTRLEMLAVVTAIRRFKTYLWGRPVTLRTDNAAVNYMIHIKEPQGQLARWLEELGCYDLQVTHRAGRIHTNADALSRRPCRQCGRLDEPAVGLNESTGSKSECLGHCAVITCQRRKGNVQPTANRGMWLQGWDSLELHDSQIRDSEIKLIMEALQNDSGKPDWSAVSGESQAVKTLWGQWNRLSIRDGILCRKWEDDTGETIRWQVVVPTEKRQEVLNHTHDSPAAGHMGVTRTVHRVRQGFYWVGIKRDVRQYCRQCDACTARKSTAGAPKAPMREHMTETPMTRIAVDITGPLPETTNKHKYILVIGDYFTKWSEAIPLCNQEASTVARALVDHWICRWGSPYFIHSDQGRNFESELFQQIMVLFGVNKTRTTPLHPQSNGMIERFNRTLIQMLAIYVKDCPEKWDEHLHFASMAYNSSVHSTTGFTPYKMKFGTEMQLPIHVLTGDPNDDAVTLPADTSEYETYVDEVKHRVKLAHDTARAITKKSMKVYKDHYDTGARSRQLDVGQPVWVYKPYRKKGVCPKLQCKWDKVYIITAKLDDVLYRVQKGRKGKGQVIHIQRLMPYEGRNLPTWWKPQK